MHYRTMVLWRRVKNNGYREVEIHVQFLLVQGQTWRYSYLLQGICMVPSFTSISLYIIICIYRRHVENSHMGDILFFTKLFSLHWLLLKNDYLFIILGDFNVNMKSESKEKAEILDMLHSFDAILTINEHTRVTDISWHHRHRHSKTDTEFTSDLIDLCLSDHQD